MVERKDAEEGHLKVWGDKKHVFMSIEGNEYRLSPYLAREVGEGMYKLGCIAEGNKDD